MEQLKYFPHHEHALRLVYLRTENRHKEDSDNENSDDEADGQDDFVVKEQQHGGKCNMCKEDIYSFHLCYYECKRCYDYSLHKFCAELPLTLKNHHLHPAHDLTFVKEFLDAWYHRTRNGCDVCKDNRTHDGRCLGYHCSICKFNMDIICATLSQQKIVVHPSHSDHQLERMIGTMISKCHACDNEHKGTFYHCPTCVWFGRIHLDCILLPTKLSIQQATDDAFTHPHLLTLAYSFPYVDYDKKYKHTCRVCSSGFKYSLWLYKCDKCRYYAHVDCATSKKGLGKTFKNFQDDDHPNLLKCPFPDESHNLLTHTFSNQISRDFLLANKEKDGNQMMINHFGHQHPLVLFNATETSSLGSKSVSLLLHNPMERVQLLCDGCVKPITMVPFYKCCLQQEEDCSFVLHTWCATMLPSEIRDHPGHPQHSVLALVPIIPDENAGIFNCGICELPCNGFAYGCTTCGYYVDINCAFIPKEITHEAHPNHLLSLVKHASSEQQRYYCVGCLLYLKRNKLVYHCPSCNFYLHTSCALLLPKIVRQKYDKHQLTLRYEPAENHPSEYFCDICEEEFDPRRWFYHCTTCDASVHSVCAPVILQREKAVPSRYKISAFQFLNVKFGGSFEIGDHHAHRFTFDQGIPDDGRCRVCDKQLQYQMIFKCLEFKFAFHHSCASRYARRGGLGKTFKNFRDDDHPNLLKCPFPDESNNLLTYTFSSQIKDFLLLANNKENDGDEMINHFGHPHPLVLVNTTTSQPMERIQLLCDGCVKPITMVPFYKCCLQQEEDCSFVLHTWCATMLPSEIRDHPGHPQHSVLALVTRRIIPDESFAGIFWCGICELPCNGFAYGCATDNCGYRVDINCGFIPQEITHEAHPNHLLSLVKHASSEQQRYYCVGCLWYLKRNELVYRCPACNFYLHTRCALSLPKIVRHKYDKHPLTLRYEPVENHPSEYFCDICEEEFDPRRWFYHCSTCDASMHYACAPLIFQSEKAAPSRYKIGASQFLNVKFGGSFEFGDHPHRFTFDQGIPDDGRCSVCNGLLQYKMIFKCFECKIAFHHSCASSYARRRYI